MSKSRGNVVDPWEVLRHPRRRRLPLVLPELPAALGGLPLLGRDGRRVGAPVPADAVEHVLVLRPLRERRGPRARRLRRRRAARRTSTGGRVSRLQGLTRTVIERMDDFDCTTAGRAIADYVDELSNWYVRLNRRRFWDGDRGRVRDPAPLPGRGREAARPVHPVRRRRDPRQPHRRRRLGPPRRLPRARPGARGRRARGRGRGGDAGDRARPRRARPGEGQEPPAAAPGGDRRHRGRARARSSGSPSSSAPSST